MSQPVLTKWELGRDRYGRRVTMSREKDDFSIEIEPANQRDDGERIRSLSASLLIEAGRLAASRS